MIDPDDTDKSPAEAETTAKADKPGQSRRAAREDRLAEALRANLKRRKEQKRGRRNAPGSADDSEP